ncbi:MAG: dihydrolipoyl dehydrogenase [Thermoproteales archaeon]|nr:dihydrolipoyl dehydrogenase [Thermoproteales archaeon]
MVKHYDIIAFGTGSSLNIVSELLNLGRPIKVAVIENDMIGGICLTRGCIPSKMLLYPAITVRRILESRRLGIEANISQINFEEIMSRTYNSIASESREIEESLVKHPYVDLYKGNGTFVGEYTVDVNGKEIEGDIILLCTGSKPYIPPIDGLDEVEYLTNDNFFRDLRQLPRKFVIIGGGYIAVELGFFMAMMGSKVTIIGRRPRIMHNEEPEISELFQRDLSKYMKLLINHEAIEVRKKGEKIIVTAENKETKDNVEVEADKILIATGRASNSDITRPEKTGVRINEKGWILTDKYLQTSKQDIWACGDANGIHMYKHKANYESQILFYNAFLNRKVAVTYHAVPHAIFTEPEIASVGMKEKEAAEKYDILVGYYKYENTAMGEAMMVKDYFAKVIVDRETYRILGAHIVGPEASILIQEIVSLMYTNDMSAIPIFRGMHIHPAMSEVVERAFYNLREP